MSNLFLIAFEQLLKDCHREMDMLEVYFPESPSIRMDATIKAAKVTIGSEKNARG